MFRIAKKVSDGKVICFLSGQMTLAHAKELEAAFDRETLSINLDFREIRGVDREVLPILARWNWKGIELVHCPAYLSHWLEGIRDRTTLKRS